MEFNLPKRIENSNKSTYGRVLNIAGSDYMPGLHTYQVFQH